MMRRSKAKVIMVVSLSLLSWDSSPKLALAGRQLLAPNQETLPCSIIWKRSQLDNRVQSTQETHQEQWLYQVLDNQESLSLECLKRARTCPQICKCNLQRSNKRKRGLSACSSKCSCNRRSLIHFSFPERQSVSFLRNLTQECRECARLRSPNCPASPPPHPPLHLLKPRLKDKAIKETKIWMWTTLKFLNTPLRCMHLSAPNLPLPLCALSSSLQGRLPVKKPIKETCLKMLTNEWQSSRSGKRGFSSATRKSKTIRSSYMIKSPKS